MSDLSFTINLDTAGLEAALDAEGPLLMVMDSAVLQVAQAIQATWVGVAQRLKIRASGAYIAGITGDGSVRIIQNATSEGGVISAVVDVVATAPHSKIVEDGHVAFHLPSKINWATSPRVKYSKKGVPYLNIPFSHSAYASPEKAEAQGLTTATLRRMMPVEVYNEAKRLTRTVRQKVGPIYDAKGQFLAADRYSRGGRLIGGPSSGFFQSKTGALFENRRGARAVSRGMVNPAWQSSKFSGLFKGGPKGHSEYTTIRTITPNSPGWNIPAKQGLGVARMVASVVPQHIQGLLSAAISGALGGT